MFTLDFLFLCFMGFGAYYLGIYIRKVALPGKNSPPLKDQFLLGIPVSLVVVTPLLVTLTAAFSETDSNQIASLTTIGIIMEHGMLVNETLSLHFKRILSDQDSAHNNGN